MSIVEVADSPSIKSPILQFTPLRFGIGDSKPDTGPKRHPQYYFEDGNIIFLVENDLFRVHRHFFTRESPIFHDMLSIPVPPDTVVEGGSDDKPIVLEDVKSKDFGSLLWMWYDPKYEHVSSSVHTWYSIMSLADRWQFDTIGKIAFEAFAALPGVEALEKIAVCEKYGFKRSIVSKAYWAVCSRGYPLSYREGEQIGWVACVLIAAIRDRNVQFSEQQLEAKIAEFENYRSKGRIRKAMKRKVMKRKVPLQLNTDTESRESRTDWG